MANILLLWMIVNSLYFEDLVNDPCIIKYGYKFWLQIQTVILCLSCINIVILYFKIIQIEKKVTTFLLLFFYLLHYFILSLLNRKNANWVDQMPSRRSVPKSSVTGTVRSCFFLLSLIYSSKRIRHKGLLSSAGFTVLILGLLNVVWVLTGFRRYYLHNSYTCTSSFQSTLYANIIIPLISLVPFIFTLMSSFVIKITSLFLSWVMPGLFISLKKRI